MRAGLILPASAEAAWQTGIVLAVGTEPGGIEPGDKVVFPRDAGIEVRLGGTAVEVVRRSELIARVHDLQFGCGGTDPEMVQARHVR